LTPNRSSDEPKKKKRKKNQLTSRMADKLNKKQKSRLSTVTSFRDVDQFEERDDRVTYLSTNKKTETEFFGTVPPNSRLAASLALVATAVQADNLPGYKDGPARLTSGSSPPGQIKEAPALVYIDEREDYPQTQRVINGLEQDYPRNQERSIYQPPLAQQPRSDDKFSYGTRHELDYKVAYHAKGPNGELYASAPTGSNDALLFDEMARRMSKSNERDSHSKSKDKHHSSKTRGWLLGL
jgi:hypothetical protein